MRTLHPAFQAMADREVLQLARATAAGAEIHLVGGALRDSYLGLAGPDLDLVVAGDGHDYSARLARRLRARLVLLGGDRFAAYRLVHSDLVIDVWDRQKASLHSDLERRDFTINAIAVDLNEGALVDPFRGMQDLGGRVLKAVTDTSLQSDPLRALRLVRFALLLPDFSVDPHTQDLARTAASRLDAVAVERTREELATILKESSPTQAFDLLLRLQLVPTLWSREEIAAPIREALAATLMAYELAEATCQRLASHLPDRLLSVHTLVSHALAPAPGGATPAWSRLVTRTQARAITSLSMADPNELGTDARPFLARWGEHWLEAAAISASLANAPDERFTSWLAQLVTLVESEGREVLHPQPILNGQEVQDLLDLPPGPAIGDLLKKLLDAQLRGEVKDRTDAAEFVANAHELDAGA